MLRWVDDGLVLNKKFVMSSINKDDLFDRAWLVLEWETTWEYQVP